jgi:LAO/AO transport system kinase
MHKLAEAIKAGDRRALARAITIIESDAPEQQSKASELLAALPARKAIRVGITGSPGVGKSTLIETLGLYLLGQRHRVAVLAVDPTSPLSKGSILGDKTRMQNLSKDPRAFIRPSPSRGMLGGVAPHSKEVVALLEGVGFDVVIVETVGVGQSEVAVAEMVDTFVLLVSPTSGDELQGVKKGIMELAHIVVVTKHDGDLKERAERTKHEYGHALSSGKSLKAGKWRVPVELVSAVTGEGVEKLWQQVLAHVSALK